MTKYANKISDIIIFGSAAREEKTVNDIDIVVLFKEDNLDFVKEVQTKITLLSSFIHFNWLVIERMFESSLFPTIIEEGYSLNKNKKLNKQLGYTPAYIFNFDISRLTASKKVLFSNALHGKKEEHGILHLFDGEQFGRGTVIIPLKHAREFKSFLELWDAAFKAKRLLIK